MKMDVENCRKKSEQNKYLSIKTNVCFVSQTKIMKTKPKLKISKKKK